MMRNVM